MIPEMSDPPTAGLTPNPFPPIEADRKIAHIAFHFQQNETRGSQICPYSNAGGPWPKSGFTRSS